MTYPQSPEDQQNLQGQQNPQMQPGQPAEFQPYPTTSAQYQPQPSGGTAIAAGVLACLGAFWAIIAAIINFSSVNEVPEEAAWIVWLQAIAMIIELVTLLPGAILLFRRKPNGRLLVTVGAAVHVLQGVIAVIGVLSLHQVSSRLSGGSAVGQGVAGLLIALAPAIATLILVSLPATRLWCDDSSAPRQHPGALY